MGTEIGQAHGLGVGHEQAEHLSALGKRTNGRNGCFVHAHVDELDEPSVGSDDTQGAVAGLDQLAARFNDPAQDDREAEIGSHGDHSSQEDLHAVPGGHVSRLIPVHDGRPSTKEYRYLAW